LFLKRDSRAKEEIKENNLILRFFGSSWEEEGRTGRRSHFFEFKFYLK